MANPAHGEMGDILFEMDFGGADIPVASAVAVGGAITGYNLGPFRLTGDMVETDTGAIQVAIHGGALRISGNDEDGKGVAIGTGVIWDPALNGTLVMETRVQRAVVTAGVVFAGFCDVNADDVAEPLTATGTTLTLTASDLAGFTLDSQLTATADWHMPFNGGSVSGPTDSTTVVSGTTNDRNLNNKPVALAVAGEWDLLKMEVHTDGSVDWWINEEFMQRQANALSTSVDLACYVGCWGTTSTAASLDIDYLRIRGKRDWTR